MMGTAHVGRTQGGRGFVEHVFEQVAPEWILRGPSTRFCYTRGEPDDELVESVRRHGFLAPPIVTVGGEGRELVAGAKRLCAALAAHLAHITVHVIVGEPEELLRLALHDNTAVRPLTGGEKARLCALLIGRWRMSPGKVALDWARPAGVAAQAAHVAALARAAEVPEILAALDEGALDERAAVEALALPEHVRSRMFALADSTLSLTRSELKECIRALADLVAVGRIGAEDPFGEPAFAQAISGGCDAKARAASFIKALREARSPEISRRRGMLEALSKEFRARSGARVRCDPSLESKRLEVTLEADGADELKAAIERLYEATRGDLPEKLFKPLEDE